MKILTSIALLVLLIISIVIELDATQVNPCQGVELELGEDDVSISRCTKGRCRLRKNTKIEIVLKFTPDHDVKQLRTTVNAIIVGVPFPFIGVDGTSACNNLYLEDGETKTKCPLKAGTKYVYKNAFDVLPIYPSLPSLDVHWALSESNKKDLVCFEVPAKIS